MKYVSERSVRRFIKFKGCCCSSCHNDDDDGLVQMMEFYFTKERYTVACCAVLNALDEYLKEKK
jgi:hypothetical protein